MNRGSIFALTLGCFAVVMSATTINVAITPIMQVMELSPRQAQLLSSAFLGITVILAPLSAWLADRWGAVRVFITTLLIYSIASVLCLVNNQSYVLLIAVRLLQGGCAGIIQPLAMFLLFELAPKSHQGRVFSLFGFGVVLAPAVGPGIAGWLVDHVGWQYVFVAGVVPALLAALLLFRVRLDTEKGSMSVAGRELDLSGLALLSLLVVGLLIWPIVWEVNHWIGLVTAVVLAALGWCFWIQQRRTESLLPLSLLLQPDFRRVALITTAYGTGMYGSIYLIPLWLQDGLGVSASTTGNLLLIGGGALAFSIIVAGRLVDRFSVKPVLMAAILCFVLSCGLFCLIEELSWVVLAVVLGRVGLGSIIPSLYPLISRTVDMAELRQATAFTTLLRQAGGVIGVMGIGMLLSTREFLPLTESGALPLYSAMFFIFSLLFIAAALVVHRLGR